MTMLPPSYLELEHIYLGTIGRGARTVAVTGVQSGDGVSLLAQALAARAADAGLNAIYLDLNLFRPAFGGPQIGWRPGDQSVHQALLPPEGTRSFQVVASPPRENGLLFRESSSLRQLLTQQLATYDVVIVDTSALCAVNRANIPAEILAAACDTCVLVMLAGVTKNEAARLAIDRLKSAGAKIAGVVLNDRDNPTLADEMCREVNRLRRLLPGLTRRLCRWLRGRDLLRQPS